MTIPPHSNTPANWSVSTSVTPEKTVAPTAVQATGNSKESSSTEQNTDIFRPVQTQILQEALLEGPPIRADRVAYAKQLLSDPNYPSSDMVKHLASMLVADSLRSARPE